MSATLVSPYFFCKPSKPWFTSPIAPLSSPKIKNSGYFSSSWSKLSLIISLPSTKGASLLYVGGIAGIFVALSSCSLYKWALYIGCILDIKFKNQFLRISRSLVSSPIKLLSASLAFTAKSFLIGSSMAIKSLRILVIAALLFVLSTKSLSTLTNSFLCAK